MPYKQVVDYSFGRVGGNDASHAQAIADAGYQGAMRYLADRIDAKHVDAAELRELWARGLKVGLVWENTEGDALGGYQRGVEYARRANQKADDLGYPRNNPLVPIYYAVDTETSWTYVAAYFDGICDYHAATGRPVGIYGSFQIIEAAARLEPRITFRWQTGAWSYGQVSSHAQMFQYYNLVLNRTCDPNDVFAPEWGGYNPNITPEDDMPGPADWTEEDWAAIDNRIVDAVNKATGGALAAHLGNILAGVQPIRGFLETHLDPRANPNDEVVPLRDLVENVNDIVSQFDTDTPDDVNT